MTRPRKQTVDYFPHTCNHGQTMFVIEQRHGNDGYAFWFKLLELLGRTEGHFLDCNKLTTWNYLSAKTLVSKEKAEEILNLLSELEAIDAELWNVKVIWSDNFLKGLSFAYRNRDFPIPDKPDYQLWLSRISGVSDEEYPQSKVKERKEKESKGNEIYCQPMADAGNSFNVQFLAKLWNEIAPPELSRVNLPFKRPPKAMAKIKDALKRNPEPDWWVRAIQRIYDSPFLRGEKGWKADIDFVAGKAEQILDGKYDGSKTSRAASGALEWLESRRRDDATSG
jgi:hypothetical protein